MLGGRGFAPGRQVSVAPVTACFFHLCCPFMLEEEAKTQANISFIFRLFYSNLESENLDLSPVAATYELFVLGYGS